MWACGDFKGLRAVDRVELRIFKARCEWQASAGGEKGGQLGATMGTWGVKGASALRLAQNYVPSLGMEASGAPPLLVPVRGVDRGPAVPGEPLRRFPGGRFPFEKFFGNFSPGPKNAPGEPFFRLNLQAFTPTTSL